MGIINTGEHGITLKEILSCYDNKNFETIECRCVWYDENDEFFDELFGFCQYKNGELISLDGDSYSLDDLYIMSEERENGWLTVYEYGEYTTESK